MALYCTEYVGADGKLYGDLIEADSWEAAQKFADARGRGETVIGGDAIVIPADQTTPEKMSEMIDALNERDRSIKH